MATLAALRIWSFAGGAAVGAAVALLLTPDPGPGPGVGPDPEPPRFILAVELSAVSRRLDDIEQTLGAVLAAERVDERVPVEANRSSTVQSPEVRELLAQVAASMQRLENDLRSHKEAVLEALTEGGWLASPPTLEELRAGKPDVDEAQVGALSALFDANPEAAQKSVRHMTVEEVLARFGPPSWTTRKGKWVYKLPGYTIALQFERNYVTYASR